MTCFHSSSPNPVGIFGHSQDRRKKCADQGVTLLEIMVAMAIMALLMMVTIPAIESYSGVHLREEAGRISGAIRYLYGESALSGKVCRLVFDMEESSWWAECAQGRFTVEQEKGFSSSFSSKNEMEEKKGKPGDEVEELREKIEKKAEFAQFQDEEIPKSKLPDATRLAVWTSHQKDKQTDGRAFLYFFPQGNTERAQIYLSSSHGDVYTLVVSALNGRVKVEDQELSLPRN